jgi:Uma2 family endonuclease
MNDVIERPPRTIMEVYKMLPEGTLAELINGNIYMSPSPLREHQRLILKLVGLMDAYVEKMDLGEVNVAHYDVYLDENSNAVQPDIIFVAKENAAILKDHIHGVPDLLVEILSAGNKNYDLEKKKDLYEKFEVKEYWVIDPVSKQSIGYIIENSKYVEFFKGTGKMTSRLLDHTFNF